ncbi:Coiled-coil domain-containing protein 78 xCCDC78 [Channa argus]|uniref:Coiled-coil domain-containing protein 78 xCCDC78 n=1 Tax=Channa argus TaxID=215402 RepID=A0A6G1QPC1_CHAAH|nr:Coiled-coil domain-containing protein 78 xCCDC78 [Channa argus]
MNNQEQQPTSNELQEQFQVVTKENLQLRDKNEQLFTKVGYLESRLGHLASSNTDLSYRLVQSEEEKLKISKELVEEKIQSNKMREQFEEEMFELKNKILNQDSVITELEMERDKLFRDLQSAEAHLKVGEKGGHDLTEEYATLKKKHLALAEAHEKEVAQSEELSAELLALAQAQDALRRQLEEQQLSVKTTTQGLHGELHRVRALISRMSHTRVKLLENQDEIKDKLEKMKNSYEEQQKKLEERVLCLVSRVAMGKEHQENKRIIHNNQQKLSEQSANQVKEVEAENSKLQLKVKELNEEFRARLVCYLQDLAVSSNRHEALTEYIDGFGQGKGRSEGTKMRVFVDNMLQDVRSSYRVREEQLASAARSYKKRLQRVTQTHHALLIAYSSCLNANPTADNSFNNQVINGAVTIYNDIRVQREQILAKPESGLDAGTPEAHFNLEPSELRYEAERELQHLRQDKARLEGQLQVTQQQLGLEKERVLLITRVTVAEAQVLELQDYIDNHLGRVLDPQHNNTQQLWSKLWERLDDEERREMSRQIEAVYKFFTEKEQAIRQE